MPQDEASFEFPKFKVSARFVGDENGPAYQTAIDSPGFETANSGVVLNRLPLFSSAARAAISQFRTLLAEGVKAFVDDYRQNSGVISLKALQDMRLTFLSWHDMASAIGDEALAAADAELSAEESRESQAVYGKEQKENKLVEYHKTYDLGTVVISVLDSGARMNTFPVWGVTATLPGTDMQAHTYIGVQSPFPAHAALGMINNLQNVLTKGVERYFAEVPETTVLTPVTETKQLATEALYALAHEIGVDGLAVAEQKALEIAEQEKRFLEDEALAYMEAEVAAKKERLKNR
jgi:hypothetical protein